MKLGAKIIMGFILTNVIFVALVVLVYIFMQPVKFGANDLSENVLPLLDQSADLQYNVAMQGSLMRAYLVSNNDNVWKEAVKFSDLVTKDLEALQKNLQSSSATPSISPRFWSLSKACKATMPNTTPWPDRFPSGRKTFMTPASRSWTPMPISPRS
jgi:Predicted periplasmic ligand-binding sensor domain